jgi:hypothetical protein
MAGGGKTSNSNTDILSQLSQSLFSTINPVTQGVAGTVSEGLQTGGIGMLMPAISNAISSAKSALSNTLSNSYYGSSMFGGARSPFQQANMQQTEALGNQNIATIGPNMTMSWLQTMIPALFGQQNAALGGLSSASSASAGMTSSANQAFAQMMSSALGAAGTGAGIAGKAAVA